MDDFIVFHHKYIAQIAKCIIYTVYPKKYVFALLCFVVVIHWLIFPYPSGLLHWHCGNLTIAPVPAKQPWWISINTSCELIMNDCVTTTKQSTTKTCACFLGYTVYKIAHYIRFFFRAAQGPTCCELSEQFRLNWQVSMKSYKCYNYCGGTNIIL